MFYEMLLSIYSHLCSWTRKHFGKYKWCTLVCSLRWPTVKASTIFKRTAVIAPRWLRFLCCCLLRRNCDGVSDKICGKHNYITNKISLVDSDETGIFLRMKKDGRKHCSWYEWTWNNYWELCEADEILTPNINLWP